MIKKSQLFLLFFQKVLTNLKKLFKIENVLIKIQVHTSGGCSSVG